MSLVPVRPGDEKKPYYHYYAAGIAPNTKEDYDFLENRAWKGRGSGIEFADRNDVLTEKIREVESGLYPLDAGGYVTITKIPVPHITSDMMWWWCAWHTLDPLRYACWDPEDHVNIEISEEDRRRLLDNSVPLRERTWGMEQIPTEIIHGAPAEPVHIHIKKPSDIGMDMSLIGTPDCRYISCGITDLGEMKIVILATLADTQEGSEFRELFYFGYTVEDGKAISLVPPVDIPPLKMAAEGALMHSRKEYRNLDKVLPELYEQYKGKPLDFIA